MAKSLYICYFGLREPLVQTQVLPYLREIRKDGVDITLLTFEPNFRSAWDKGQLDEMKRALADEGIAWEYLPYHKRPSAIATAWDIFRGAVRTWRLHKRNRFDIFHCRVHVPGLMALIANRLSRRKAKILFDVRGFFPEEFVDAGIWPEGGLVFRLAKAVEKWIMKRASGFVVLTENARNLLFPESEIAGLDREGRPVAVIPCCADLAKFRLLSDEQRLDLRRAFGVAEKKVFVYVGSFGGWYLSEEMIDLFLTARTFLPNAYLMVLTQRQVKEAQEMLRERGVPTDCFDVRTVTSDEIYRYLNASDVGISLIKPCFSKRSSSPTKNAEYFACGIPVIANDGIGDVTEQIEDNRVGSILSSFDSKSYQRAINAVLAADISRDHCRAVATELFDLETVAGKRYREIYARMLDITSK